MIIIHVDMDAFFAAVEERDAPNLVGKPVIIGALPGERGVVATCNYEARKYGIRSAMPTHEAYNRCPNGVFLRPSMGKYQEASAQIHRIWDSYTDLCEYISLDEGFLDVTGSAHLFGGALAIALKIKERTVEEVGLTCSVGIGYSMMSAKLASEENKPNGLFQIPDAQALCKLIGGRSTRTIYGVGAKTEAALAKYGITTVRHVQENFNVLNTMFGKHGPQIYELACGIDTRRVTPLAQQKSIGTEYTFPHDIADFDYLQDVLLLIARKLSYQLRTSGIFCSCVTIKITFANANMQSVTRSKTGAPINSTRDIFAVAQGLLHKIERRQVRLLGISLSTLGRQRATQLTLFENEGVNKAETVDDAMLKLQQKYGSGIVKTAAEMHAENRLR